MPDLTQAFIEWFVGFADGEGCFQIILKGNHVCFSFSIELHKDDRAVLDRLAKVLGVGTVYVNSKRNTVTFTVRKFNDILTVIIPIFQRFPLQTKKYLDYLCFVEAVIIVHSNKLNNTRLSSLDLEKILKLKQSMNSMRTSISEEELKLLTEKVSITKWWLVGFIEGEGTFGYKSGVPYFQIAQHDRSLYVLKAIEDFLKREFSLINSKNKELKFTFTINKRTDVWSMTLQDIDCFYYSVIPYLETLRFFSRKGLDYDWWVISVLIHRFGYIKLDEGKKIAMQISSSTNKFRYSTADIQSELPSVESIMDLFSQTPPFDCSSGQSYTELVRSHTIARGSQKGFIVHVYECSSTSDIIEIKGSPFSNYGKGHEALGLRKNSRAIGRNIDTGKLYKGKYMFTSKPLK